MYVSGEVQLTGSNVKVDGAALPIIPAMKYNGATYDLERNNMQGTLLASGARTATISSPNQTNYNARGIIVFLNVTGAPGAPGAGGLLCKLAIIDPISGNTSYVNADPTAVTATGIYAYLFYPGASGASVTAGIRQFNSAALPRTFLVQIYHLDAQSYTYSVGQALIL